ncbi:hypothetical protein BDZ97DRAFT_1921367 [Flammula alnicola]|nr:hypothetical protein BDZ97DRAFT_1921367 [Flammula alnicola]
MSPEEPPLLLTKVCKQWRLIAYGTPRLWTTMIVYVRHPSLARIPSEDFPEQWLCVARNWLCRSGALPLRLTLQDDRHWSKISPFLELFIQFSARWQAFKFSGSPCSMKLLANLCPTKVPLLTDLTFTPTWQGYGHDEEGGLWDEVGLFKTPNLQILTLEIPPSDLEVIDFISLHLTQLDLQVHGITRSELVGLFNLCPGLSAIRLDVSVDVSVAEEDHVNTGPIKMKCLERMSIYTGFHLAEETDSGIDDFLCCLELPSLCHIEFGDFPFSDKLLDFLSGVRNTVRTFGTNFQGFSQDNLLKCLQSLVHLTSLSIAPFRRKRFEDDIFTIHTRIGMTLVVDGFLEGLNKPRNTGYICPRLQEFECSTYVKFKEQSLVDFITHRFETPNLRDLNAVSVIFRQLSDIDVKERLAPFIQDGLKLKLLYPAYKDIMGPLWDDCTTLNWGHRTTLNCHRTTLNWGLHYSFWDTEDSILQH